MSEQKSKMPDMNEIMGMTKKLFNDLKNSVCEIAHDYKKKRAEETVKQDEVKKTPQTKNPKE